MGGFPAQSAPQTGGGGPIGFLKKLEQKNQGALAGQASQDFNPGGFTFGPFCPVRFRRPLFRRCFGLHHHLRYHLRPVYAGGAHLLGHEDQRVPRFRLWLHAQQLGPPAVCFLPFLFGGGFPHWNRVQKKIGCPSSNLSTGGPRQGFPQNRLKPT